MANTNENAMYHCFIFFMSIFFSYLLHFVIRKYTNPNVKARYPPSPPALPVIGHLHLVGSTFPQSFQTLARRYGPLMQIRIGSTAFIVASNRNVAKEIIITNDANFASKFEIGPTDYNIYQGTGFITAPNGEYWRFMRKLCMTKLFGVSQQYRFSNIREQEVTNLLKSLLKCAREGELCNLSVELENLANSLMCKMAMSRRFSKKENEAKELRKMVVGVLEIASKMSLNEMFGILKKVDLFGNGKKLRNALLEYDSLMEQIMKEYDQNSVNIGNDEGKNQEKDTMDLLMEIQRDTNAEIKLTRPHIKHFIIELLLASIDTTAAAIQWSMAELINHPLVYKKLRDEIESVTGSAKLVRESDLSNLPYLQAVVKESLRLHTPQPIIHRECSKDCKISGYDIKAKDKILINAYAIMRDPESWDDADEYMPERFTVNSENPARTQDFSYIPYGGGRRSCIGNSHSYKVMELTIANLVQCFDWKAKDGEEIDKVDGSRFSGNNAPRLVSYPISRFDPFN